MASPSASPSSLSAVITGGGTGFGRSIAIELCKEFLLHGNDRDADQVTLILVGRRRDPLEHVKAELRREIVPIHQSGSKSKLTTRVLAGSVASLETWKAVARVIEGECDGRLHFLANNAALPDPGAPWDEMTDPQTQIIDFNATNISSVELAYHFLVPFLTKGAAARRDKPSIVLNVSSCASVNPRAFAHDLPMYTPSKCAVDAITRCSYGLYKRRNVLSFAINPVAYDTPILRLACQNLGLDDPHQLAERYNPFPVLGDPRHVGQLAASLVKDPSWLEAGCSYNVLPLPRELSAKTEESDPCPSVASPQSMLCSIDYANGYIHSTDTLAQFLGWSRVAEAWDQHGHALPESQLSKIRAAFASRIEEGRRRQQEGTTKGAAGELSKTAGSTA